MRLVLSSLDANGRALSSVTLNDIDKFFDAKLARDGDSRRLPVTVRRYEPSSSMRRSIAGVCRDLRREFEVPFCPKTMAFREVPHGAMFRRLLRHESKLTTPAGLRAHAMLLLWSIYALRSSEVANLRLGDIDWREETFCVRARQGRWISALSSAI